MDAKFLTVEVSFMPAGISGLYAVARKPGMTGAACFGFMTHATRTDIKDWIANWRSNGYSVNVVDYTRKAV
jgi:hypothetical protein